MTKQNGHNNQYTINGDDKEEYLFDAAQLQSIFKHFSLQDNKLHDNIYNEKYLLRPLKLSDYDHGYIELLGQLTECGTITRDTYEQRFIQMQQCPNTYYILVIEDLNDNKNTIIGTATLVCEKKFIRQLAIRGRIEDVVIDNCYRGQQLGKILVDLLTKFGREKCDCYKISLECKDHLVHFYQQFGYNHEDKQNFLCQRFKNLSTSTIKTDEQQQ